MTTDAGTRRANRGSGFGPMLVIANPSAGRGRHAVLPQLVEALDDRGLEHAIAITSAAADATRLARDAVTERGIRFVIAVGGDGTVNEVVNGLIDPDSGEPHVHDAVLGVVAGGSGSDFARTFGLDRSPRQVARHFEGDTVYPIDIGRVSYLGNDGRPAVRLFANIAEAGFGGTVVGTAHRLPRTLGRVRYLIAAIAAARRLGMDPATVTIDHTAITEDLSNVVVANGQFFGGNLKVAPRALPDDGRFNVQIWRGEPKDVFLKLPRIRVGEHLADPDVREYQSRTVTIDAPTPLPVEADGDLLGTTPATFDLLPRVVRLKL